MPFYSLPRERISFAERKWRKAEKGEKREREREREYTLVIDTRSNHVFSPLGEAVFFLHSKWPTAGGTADGTYP